MDGSESPGLLDVMKFFPLPMLMALVLGTSGFVTAIVAIIAGLSKKRAVAPALVAVVLGLFAAGAGIAGGQMARARVREAAATPGLITANDRVRLTGRGDAEAGLIEQAGLLCGAPAVLLGLVALALGRRRASG